MQRLPLPDEQPVAVNALRNKRAAIAGEIEMHSREIDRLRGELIHLDATLRVRARDRSAGHHGVAAPSPAHRMVRAWRGNAEDL
jgi:hypothetical protein